MEITLRIPSGPERMAVVGAAERNLKMLREALGVSIAARDDVVRISGERAAVTVARSVLDELHARRDMSMTRRAVLDLIADRAARAEVEASAHDATERAGASGWDGRLEVYAQGLPVRPKTGNQRAYVDCIRRHDLTFAVGPAGTGKTYLAVAAAVHLLRAGHAQRIVLVRPAVEAGEKLGFLPGDLAEKVNPYLRPLLDALHDMMEYTTAQKLLASGVIEIAPLAFMRGRTLNGAVIILDEAQNTTRGQMKMFLTRMGHGSKVIVTGDSTQIDLPEPSDSGLIDAIRRLRRVPGVGIVGLDGADVVRHRLVQRVIEAYGDPHPTAGEAAQVARDLDELVRDAQADAPVDGWSDVG